jgi:D-3-phosphoglycerate dehydrogenase
MTARGIPVFNTPGANANSVKELVLAGLLMASRGVVEGIHHTQTKIVPESKGDHKVRVRVWVRVRVRVPRSCLSQRAITR